MDIRSFFYCLISLCPVDIKKILNTQSRMGWAKREKSKRNNEFLQLDKESITAFSIHSFFPFLFIFLK